MNFASENIKSHFHWGWLHWISKLNGNCVMQLSKGLGFNSAAQGRSSPYMGQSQGKTSQFAFYQLNSQCTALEDSSNPIVFWLFTSVFTESTLSSVTLG